MAVVILRKLGTAYSDENSECARELGDALPLEERLISLLKRILTAVVIPAVLVAAYFVFGCRKKDQSVQATTRKVIMPMRGDLTATISTDGQVEPVKTAEVKSKISVETIELNFEVRAVSIASVFFAA